MFLKDEKGFTLLELIVVLIITGIIVSISFPVLTSNNEVMYEKTIKNQIVSVFQNAATDSISLVESGNIVIGKNYYEINSPRNFSEIPMVGKSESNDEDVGKVININEKGEVETLAPIIITLSYQGEQYIVEINEGFNNIKINGEYIY